MTLKTKKGRKRNLSSTLQLMLVLLWMRQYPTECLLAFIFEISQSSLTHYIHTALQILNNHMKAWIRFPSRLKRDKNSVWWRGIRISAIIDGAEQAILKPGQKLLEQLCYSGKKCKHTFTLLIVVSPKGN
jgi:hypothetical protein